MNLFVPGRVCLFGEHSDWAAEYRGENPDLERGYALIAGTNQGLYADVSGHPDALVLTSVTSGGARHGPYRLRMEPAELLLESKQGGFWSYVAGVALQVLQRHPVRGLVIDNYQTDLPMAKGLSSSAAICVLAARAFNLVYDLGLDIREEMELAYLGEITTPSRCGLMDQGCAFGTRPVLMTFDGERLDTEEVAAGADVYLVIVDLAGRKDTRRILSRLHEAFPFARDAVGRGVQALLGPINRRIVLEAAEALRRGDAERVGALMVKAQERFDRLATPACPEELTAPGLHRVLNHRALVPHIFGGKGVGSQGDGAAQLLARSAGDQSDVIGILERDLGLSCLRLVLSARA